MWEKLKAVGDSETWYIALVMILVSIASFGLGRQSVLPNVVAGVPAEPAVQIFQAHQIAAPLPSITPELVGEPASTTIAPSESVVASRNGTRYHLASCPGAKQITEANRITFASRAAAEAAGYSPAANCPGL